MRRTSKSRLRDLSLTLLASLAISACSGGSQTGNASSSLPQFAAGSRLERRRDGLIHHSNSRSGEPIERGAAASLCLRFDAVDFNLDERRHTDSARADGGEPIYRQSNIDVRRLRRGIGNKTSDVHPRSPGCGNGRGVVHADTLRRPQRDGERAFHGHGHTDDKARFCQHDQVNVERRVSSLQLLIGTPNPPVGTRVTIPLTVNALDADGNIIIPPGTYSDASGTR